MNSKAEAFFEWLQAHPKYGLLFGVGLLALWLAGLLFRWTPAWGPSFSILSFAALSASSPAVAARGFTDAKVGWPRWIRPVSYTHLDVYKRQTLSCLNAKVIQIFKKAQPTSCVFAKMFFFAINLKHYRGR